MNERIKELALQSGACECRNDIVTTAIDIEKFAELIVRECANQTRWSDFEMSTEQRIRLSVYHSILEHFGVK